jgi:endoglucanase
MKSFAVFARFFLLAVSLSAVSAVSALAETPVDRHGQLAVNGNRLVNKDGKPVQLRGMSYFWSMAGEASGYYNANVVNWLADDWKINVIRAAMGIKESWGQGYLNGGKEVNKQRVVTVADAAVAKGIYVIIDWHTEKAYEQTDDAKAFFEEMANKYKGVPNVIYEIFNEPVRSGTLTSANFWANMVKPYAQTLVDAIRAIDPNNVIIIGTPMYSQDVDVATADPVEGKNLVYALHFYSYTHKESLRVKARTAMNTNGKAIFVSEFGVCDAQGDGKLDLPESDKWLNFLDSNMVSWANWSISNKAEAASALKPGTPTSGNWTSANLTESGAYVRGKLIAAYEREDAGTAALAAERAVPAPPQTGGSAAIAPAAAQSNNFSAGPIPASKSSGGVKFFWQGKAVTGGSLLIYDAIGNVVKSIRISGEVSVGGLSKRAIGSWNLTDAKNRRVKAGSYLVKGKIVTRNGSVMNVSSIAVISN